MTQRFSLVCLFLSSILFLAGCKENTEVSQSIASMESQGAGVMNVPESLPLPTDEMLATLGPLNDLNIRWLLSDPVYVATGHPSRFLSSPLGKGNEELVNGMLSQFLQTPMKYDDVECFVQSLNMPVEVIVETTENGVKVPRKALLNRRSTTLIYATPLKQEEFFKSFFSGARKTEEFPKRTIGNREFYDLTPPNLAVPQKLALYFADEKTVVIIEGDEPSLQEAFDDKPPTGAAIERLRRTNAADADIVVVASREGVPFEASQIQFSLQQYGVAPGLANILAVGLCAVSLTVNTGAEEGKPMVAARIDTATAKSATDVSETFLGLIISGQTWLASADETGKSQLPIPADFALSLLNSLKVDATDSRVDAILTKFSGFDAIATKGIADTQHRIQEEQKLQQRFNQLTILSRAFMGYYQKNQKFPTTILSADGKSLLSWRVALLSIIQNELYQKFKLDEPWDSPTNKPLIDEMPPLFSPTSSEIEKGRTLLRYFTSEGTPFGNKDLKAENIQWPQTTLLLVNVVPEKAVEWTKPDPLDFDIQQLEETVGKVLVGVSFAGQPTIIPLIPSADPRSVFQKEYLSALVKGQPLPTPPQQPASGKTPEEPKPTETPKPEAPKPTESPKPEAPKPTETLPPGDTET